VRKSALPSKERGEVIRGKKEPSAQQGWGTRGTPNLNQTWPPQAFSSRETGYGGSGGEKLGIKNSGSKKKKVSVRLLKLRHKKGKVFRKEERRERR